MRYDLSPKNSTIDEKIQGFRVNIKQEKKSKLSSVVLKLRGIDEVADETHHMLRLFAVAMSLTQLFEENKRIFTSKSGALLPVLAK